jgi:hypothetical protein
LEEPRKHEKKRTIRRYTCCGFIDLNCMRIICNIIFIVLIITSCNHLQKWDNTALNPELLTYKGLPMTTSRQRLLKSLGKPDSIAHQQMSLSTKEGIYNNGALVDLYYYNIDDGNMCFAVYKGQATIYIINFGKSKIELKYKYGGVLLSKNLSYSKACKTFSGTTGTETTKGIITEVLLFSHQKYSKSSGKEVPILKFSKGYLSQLFKYPAFYE